MINEELNNWLAQKNDLPAVLAAGIIHPDKTTFSQIFSEQGAEVSPEKLWPVVSELIASAKHQNFPDGRWTWVFARSAVHCTLRKDGACLALLSRRETTSEHLAAVSKMLAEFRNL